MRILTFSSLYPNSLFPVHGIFVETRLRKLLERSGWEAEVVAPVPFFPLHGKRFGDYAKWASVPARETLHRIDVSHPRFFAVPRLTWMLTPFAMAAAAYATVRRLQARFDFDLIDAHYLFPDGVAAALLAERLGKPFVMTARGSDVTLIPKWRFPLHLIRWAAGRAAAVITVSESLSEELAGFGVDAGKLLHLRNGVDLQSFQPLDPENARADLGLGGEETVIASVGHLIPRKGHDIVISALGQHSHVRLLVVGSGPEEARLREQANRLGVAERVDFLGQLAQKRLVTVYSAANALVLASSREGWANVLLEAMACGCPVVATDIPGTREVVTQRSAGVLVKERDPRAIAAGLERLLGDPPRRSETRQFAERFSWDDTSDGQMRLFRRITGQASIGTPTPAGANAGCVRGPGAAESSGPADRNR